jgi:ketosteroid isomerase-like protein
MYRRAMDVGAAAREWVDAWSQGWAAHDPDVIAARYGDDCEFRSHPFREPLSGREGARRYAEQAFAEEHSAVSSFAEPIVAADGRAAVEYRATIRTIDGRTTMLSGVTVLRFDADGLVQEHRDYSATTEPS